MSSQIPNYCGSNIIQYLNDKFTYQVKSDFQAELIALDNAIAKAVRWAREPYDTRPVIGFQMKDGTIFTEYAPERIVYHGNTMHLAEGMPATKQWAAFQRCLEVLNRVDLFGTVAPELLDSTVCFCDTDHPTYCDPPVWTDSPRCCGGGGNPKLKDGIHNGGHEWNCPVIRCPRHKP